MQTTARSLILDLLSTLRHGSMSVRALIEAGDLLDIAENNIRVSLARLRASARVERDERGSYRLGPAIVEISGLVRSWREIDQRTRPWSGSWIALHQSRLGRGPLRRRRERALTLLGFRELEPGLAIRPDNLRDDVAALRSQLLALVKSNPADHDDAAGVGRVFTARDLDAQSDAQARELWAGEALLGKARESTVRLRESANRIAEKPIEEAMVETFLVGGAVLRQLLQHPLLPPEILDPEPLEELLAEMKRYDELGRACWAPFLARHRVPHRALPLDSQRSSEELAYVPVRATAGAAQ